MKHEFDQGKYQKEIDARLKLDQNKKEQLAQKLQEYSQNVSETAKMVERGLQHSSDDIDGKPYIPAADDERKRTGMPHRLRQWGSVAAAVVLVAAVSVVMLPNFFMNKPGTADSEQIGVPDTVMAAADTAACSTILSNTTATAATESSAEVTASGKAVCSSSAAHSAAVSDPTKSRATDAGGNPSTSGTVNKTPAISVRPEKESYPVGTKGINLIIRDDNNVGCGWGLNYDLDIDQGGQWVRLTYKDSIEIPAIAQVLQPNPNADYTETTSSIDFSLMLKDPQLAPGHYRVAKEISGSTYYAEFSISDNG